MIMAQRKIKSWATKKLRKQEREWEDEKEWLERVLQKALQVPGISSDACTGSNLYPDFSYYPMTGIVMAFKNTPTQEVSGEARGTDLITSSSSLNQDRPDSLPEIPCCIIWHLLRSTRRCRLPLPCFWPRSATNITVRSHSRWCFCRISFPGLS